MRYDIDFFYQVQFSMLEIYNEQVRDLLNPQGNKKGGLKVRQHPKKGFYCQGLKILPVVSYDDIEDRMEEGTQNRTVAATNMNATSRYDCLAIVGYFLLDRLIHS